MSNEIVKDAVGGFKNIFEDVLEHAELYFDDDDELTCLAETFTPALAKEAEEECAWARYNIRFPEQSECDDEEIVNSFANLAMAPKSNVPLPGPAQLSQGAGLDEWLEQAKLCRYLPEAAMKQLCEMVKECLMEGEI